MAHPLACFAPGRSVLRRSWFIVALAIMAKSKTSAAEKKAAVVRKQQEKVAARRRIKEDKMRKKSNKSLRQIAADVREGLA